MLLKPFDDDRASVTVVDELPKRTTSVNDASAVNDILKAAGLTKEPSAKKRDDLSEIRKAFDLQGASLQDIASTVGLMMRGAETDGGRLKAAELALKVHGVFSEIDEKSDMVININIVGSENQTLVNLLLPNVTR